MPSHADIYQRLCSTVVFILFIPLSLTVLYVGAQSFSTEMQHDTPLFYYAAFLMNNHDMFPYRDLFVTDMPGTYFIYMVLGKLFGYTPLSLNIVNIATLGILFGCTWRLMRMFGSAAAWSSCCFFGLAYLLLGPVMYLQRDYMLILPIAASLVLLNRHTHTIPWMRTFMVGFLWGCSCMIKPHAGIGLPIVLIFMFINVWNRESNRNGINAFKTLLFTCSGFITPICMAIAWLIAHDALSSFLDIAINYLPLHSRLDGSHTAIQDHERIRYLVRSFLNFGPFKFWIPAALTGVFAVWLNHKTPDPQRRFAGLLLAMAVAYSLYPVLAGKFWEYHYMPFMYFIILCGSLTLYGWRTIKSGRKAVKFILLICILTACAYYALFNNFLYRIAWNGLISEDLNQNSAIAVSSEVSAWIKPRIGPHDTVQNLDWTEGVIHAFLIARAKPATRFIYHYHFYHHISSPYIQRLRKRFIKELTTAMPKFIVDVPRMRSYISGSDTSDVFEDLTEFIANYYAPSYHGEQYIIYQRRQ